MHRGEKEVPTPKPKGKTPALVKMPSYEKCRKGDPPLGIPSPLLSSVRPSIRMCVYVYVSVPSIINSPTRGITKNRKGKLLPSPREQLGEQF